MVCYTGLNILKKSKYYFIMMLFQDVFWCAFANTWHHLDGAGICPNLCSPETMQQYVQVCTLNKLRAFLYWRLFRFNIDVKVTGPENEAGENDAKEP